MYSNICNKMKGDRKKFEEPINALQLSFKRSYEEYIFIIELIFASLLRIETWPIQKLNTSWSKRWNWGWEQTLKLTEAQKKEKVNLLSILCCRELNLVIKYVMKYIKMGAFTSVSTSYCVFKWENFIVRHFPSFLYTL